jgi:hypothetical protein
MRRRKGNLKPWQRRLRDQKREYDKARREARLQEAWKIVATGRCPQCGTTLYRNLSLTGWWQCGHYGSPGFQREPGPHCSFETFTD